MKALVLMHIENEGPGTLGDYLGGKGISVETLRLARGDRLPSRPAQADLIVSMGGPMNVYDDGKHPFLREETAFLSRAPGRQFHVEVDRAMLAGRKD